MTCRSGMGPSGPGSDWQLDQ